MIGLIVSDVTPNQTVISLSNEVTMPHCLPEKQMRKGLAGASL